MEFILWILEKGHLEIIRKSWYGLIFFMIEYNKIKNRNVLDVRASLKVGLQMEQDNFPSHKMS